jgi:hypothetical protein
MVSTGKKRPGCAMAWLEGTAHCGARFDVPNQSFRAKRRTLRGEQVLPPKRHAAQGPSVETWQVAVDRVDREGYEPGLSGVMQIAAPSCAAQCLARPKQ